MFVKYTKPFEITQTATIQAFVKNGNYTSDTVSAQFFKKPNNFTIDIKSKYNPQYHAGVITSYSIHYTKLYEDAAKARIKHLMTLAKTSLEMKREVVQRNIDSGLLPYTKRYLGNLNHHFSTIGVRITSYNVCYTKLLRAWAA